MLTLTPPTDAATVPEHDPAMAEAILALARTWTEDPTGALMDLPLDAPGFDAAFHGATAALTALLGSETPRFVRDVYWIACSRLDRGPFRDTAREIEFVFVPFVAQPRDLSPVTGDYERVVGFADAFEASGYGGPDDFIVFFPRPMRAKWLLDQEPGALRRALNGLVDSLLAKRMDPPLREAELRAAFHDAVDPEGALPPPEAEPCVRALLGLHMRTVYRDDADATARAPETADRFIAALAQTYPTLSCGPPGDPIQTVGRMTVMDLVERWIAEAGTLGLTLALGGKDDPQPDWAERIGAIHVYHADAQVQIIAEMSRTLLGPYPIGNALWHLVEPEVIGALEAYADRVVRHDGGFGLPQGYTN